MLTPDELRESCDYCDEKNINLLCIEGYHGISYGKDEATALSYSSKAIIINSISKYYSCKCLKALSASFMNLYSLRSPASPLLKCISYQRQDGDWAGW